MGKIVETGDIMGVIPHRRLMELKKSGVVCPSLLEEIANDKFKDTMELIIEGLLKHHKGFCWHRLAMYNEVMARKDAELMFSTRKELIDHVLATNYSSKFIPVPTEVLEVLVFADRAALSATISAEVVNCFAHHSEVITAPHIGLNVDWVMQHQNRIRTLLGEHF